MPTTIAAAPLDRAARVATGLVWVVAVLLWAAGGGAFANGDTSVGALMIAAALVDVALCLWVRRIQPVGYRLEPDCLVVERRRAGDLRIPGPLGAVTRQGLGLRVLGSGGLYGYIGRFRLRGGGMARAFATDLGRLVVVAVGEASIAISPADPATVPGVRDA